MSLSLTGVVLTVISYLLLTYVVFILSTLVSVHPTSEEFENAALFLRLGLPSTLIRHENGACRKRFSNRTNLRTPALRFGMEEKHFENGALYLRLGLPSTLIRHENGLVWTVGLTGEIKLRFREGLVWTVGLTIEIKLRFQIHRGFLISFK